MNINTLATVRAVGRSLSFSAAAEELFCSQSSVSKKVAAFEKEVGVKVFVRNGRSDVSVTENGERVLYWAGRVLEHYDGFVAAADRYTGTKKNELTVGGPRLETGVSERLLLTAFCQKYPELRLVERHMRGAYYYDAVLNGRVDALLLYTGGPMRKNLYVVQIISDAALECVGLCPARMYILVSASGRFAGLRSAEIGAFRDELFSFSALRDVGMVSFVEGQLLDLCSGQEPPFVPRVFKREGGAGLLEELKLCAAGRIVLPVVATVPLSVPGVVPVRVESGDFRLTLSVVYRRDRHTETLKNFIAFAAESHSFFESGPLGWPPSAAL